MAIITLVTGKPGNGKTLNTLKEVHEEFAGKRPIFYWNIPELTLEGWQEIEGEAYKTLHEDLPENAVIVMDEVDRIFPPRSNSKVPPPWVDGFTTHRHRGHDFYLVTQHPSFIDHKIKVLCGRHVHYHRIFGSQKTTRTEWNAVVNPDLEASLKKAERSSTVTFDKEFFSKYKSAAIHTNKLRIPPIVWWSLACVPIFILCLVAFWYIMPGKTPKPEAAPAAAPAQSPAQSAPSLPGTPRPSPAQQQVADRRMSAVVVKAQGYFVLVQDAGGAEWHRAASCTRDPMGQLYCSVDGVRYRLRFDPTIDRDDKRKEETLLSGSPALASRSGP